MMELDLVPIGVVRSPVSDRRLMPSSGVPAEIHVWPEYADGLLLIEENSHIWVIGWFDDADREHLQVARTPYSPPRRRRGVFGLRSTARPNPLSLTAVRLLGVDGNVVRVDSLDLIDGTRVLDIKRYSPSWDSIFSARSARDRYFADRAADPAVLEDLEWEALHFHGERCRDVVAGARLIQHLAVQWAVAPKDDGLQVVVGGHPSLAHLVDAVQALTAATIGTGRLRVAGERQIIFTHAARRMVVEPLPTDDLDLDTLRRVEIHRLFRLVEA